MATSPTKQVNVRLGERARAQLAALQESTGASAAAVITMALDRFYREHQHQHQDTGGTESTAPATSTSVSKPTESATSTGAPLSSPGAAGAPTSPHKSTSKPTSPPAARRTVLATYDPDLD